MDAKLKKKIEITIVLDEVEAKDLESILNKIKTKPSVSKSEFSLRQKQLADLLQETLYEILIRI